MKKIFNEPDLLAYLQISRSTLWRWRKEHGFPKGIRLGIGVSGVIRWDKADIDAWVDSRRAESANEA